MRCNSENFWKNLADICSQQYDEKNPARYENRRKYFKEIQREYNEAYAKKVTPQKLEAIRRKAFNEVNCFGFEREACCCDEEALQRIKDLEEDYYFLVDSDMFCSIFMQIHKHAQDYIISSSIEKQMSELVQFGDGFFSWEEFWEDLLERFRSNAKVTKQIEKVRDKWSDWVATDALAQEYGDRVPRKERKFKKNER